jgi:hypothetical protein
MAGSNAQLSKNSREPKGLPKPKRRVKNSFSFEIHTCPLRVFVINSDRGFHI